jgi:hypothetical protein
VQYLASLNSVDWVLTKNFYDALYLGTNFELLNALYFKTEGVGPYVCKLFTQFVGLYVRCADVMINNFVLEILEFFY